jgi:hypothetical protein
MVGARAGRSTPCARVVRAAAHLTSQLSSAAAGRTDGRGVPACRRRAARLLLAGRCAAAGPRLASLRAGPVAAAPRLAAVLVLVAQRGSCAGRRRPGAAGRVRACQGPARVRGQAGCVRRVLVRAPQPRPSKAAALAGACCSALCAAPKDCIPVERNSALVHTGVRLCRPEAGLSAAAAVRRTQGEQQWLCTLQGRGQL